MMLLSSVSIAFSGLLIQTECTSLLFSPHQREVQTQIDACFAEGPAKQILPTSSTNKFTADCNAIYSAYKKAKKRNLPLVVPCLRKSFSFFESPCQHEIKIDQDSGNSKLTLQPQHFITRGSVAGGAARQYVFQLRSPPKSPSNSQQPPRQQVVTVIENSVIPAEYFTQMNTAMVVPGAVAYAAKPLVTFVKYATALLFATAGILAELWPLVCLLLAVVALVSGKPMNTGTRTRMYYSRPYYRRRDPLPPIGSLTVNGWKFGNYLIDSLAGVPGTIARHFGQVNLRDLKLNDSESISVPVEDLWKTRTTFKDSEFSGPESRGCRYLSEIYTEYFRTNTKPIIKSSAELQHERLRMEGPHAGSHGPCDVVISNARVNGDNREEIAEVILPVEKTIFAGSVSAAAQQELRQRLFKDKNLHSAPVVQDAYVHVYQVDDAVIIVENLDADQKSLFEYVATDFFNSIDPTEN